MVLKTLTDLISMANSKLFYCEYSITQFMIHSSFVIILASHFVSNFSFAKFLSFRMLGDLGQSLSDFGLGQDLYQNCKLWNSPFSMVTVMSVITLCWWFYDGDRFKMLVTESLCWRLFSLYWWFFQCITNTSRLQYPSPTSMSPILFPS